MLFLSLQYRNEYGMTTDNYYYEYLQTQDENDLLQQVYSIQSDIEDYELRERKLERILN